jgi:glycosyltransferase involved in cell wall biosynthesis
VTKKLLIFDPCGFVTHFSISAFKILGVQKSSILINNKKYHNLYKDIKLPFSFFSKHKIIKFIQYIINLIIIALNIKKFSYKAIIFQMSPVPIIDYLFFSMLKKKTKIVFTLHNDIPFHGDYFFFRNFFYINLIKIFDKVIVHTLSSKKFLDNINYEKKNIIFQRLPINPKSKKNINQSVITNKIKLLFFGIIRPYKGLVFFLNGFNHLEQKVQSMFEVTICGSMSQLNYENKKNIIEICKNNKNIKLIDDFVTNSFKEKLFLKNNFIILPYTNASGTSVGNEAINYLIPPILSDLDSFKEVFVDSTNCFMFEKGNSYSIAKKLTDISNITNNKYTKIKSNLNITKKKIITNKEYWNNLYNSCV